jgi:hypothetical protein
MAINWAFDLYRCCPTCGLRYLPTVENGGFVRVPEHFDQRTDCEIVPMVCWGSGMPLNRRTALGKEKHESGIKAAGG